MSRAATPVADADGGLPPPLERSEHSKLGRAIGTFIARFIIRPITRLLALFGIWPHRMSRAINRTFEKGEKFVPTEHDVVIASFFKSGTNWTMQIATQIAWRGNAEFRHIHDLVPWVDLPPRAKHFTVPVVDALWQHCPTQLRIIKTHLPFGRIVYNEAAKYVWVVRDPKDVFVSSYHFLGSVVFGPIMPPLEEWLDLFVSQDSFNGSWAEHLDCGWRARDRNNVLFLTYEEMKRDRPEAVQRIAELMGVDLTAEELDSVNQRSSYEYMKSHGHQFDTVGLSPPWANSRGTMVRRGKAGGSNELLTPEQQRRIDDYWRSELLRIGSDFPYDEHYC
jgi:hypothetical protein